MKDGEHQVRREISDQSVARRLVTQNEIIEMPVVNAMRRDDRPAHDPSGFEIAKALVVTVPDIDPLLAKASRLLELRPKHGSSELDWQERRADIDPAIFIDAARFEIVAVRS